MKAHGALVGAALLGSTLGCASSSRLLEIVPYRAAKIRHLLLNVNHGEIVTNYAERAKQHSPGQGRILMERASRFYFQFNDRLAAEVTNQLESVGVAVTRIGYPLEPADPPPADAVLSLRLTKVKDWDDNHVYAGEYDVSLRTRDSDGVTWRSHAVADIGSRDGIPHFAVLVVESLRRAGAI